MGKIVPLRRRRVELEYIARQTRKRKPRRGTIVSGRIDKPAKNPAIRVPNLVQNNTSPPDNTACQIFEAERATATESNENQQQSDNDKEDGNICSDTVARHDTVIYMTYLQAILEINSCTEGLQLPVQVSEGHLSRYWNSCRFIEGTLDTVTNAVTIAGSRTIGIELEFDRLFARDPRSKPSVINNVIAECIIRRSVQQYKYISDCLSRFLSFLPGIDLLNKPFRVNIVMDRTYDLVFLLCKEGYLSGHCIMTRDAQISRLGMNQLVEPAFWDAMISNMCCIDEIRLSDEEYVITLATILFDPDRMKESVAGEELRQLYSIYFKAFTRMIGRRRDGLSVFKNVGQLLEAFNNVHRISTQFVRYLAVQPNTLPWVCVKNGQTMTFCQAMDVDDPGRDHPLAKFATFFRSLNDSSQK